MPVAWLPDFVMAIEALPKISRTRSADPLEQRVGEGLVIVPVPLVISADRTLLRVYKAE